MPSRTQKRRGPGSTPRSAKKGGTTLRPEDGPGTRTTPIPPHHGPGPGWPFPPFGPGPLDPAPDPPDPAPADPIDNYVRDEDRNVIVQWHPGRPARGGSHTQIHTGDGYSFQITIFWNARGEIESFVIVNTDPGGPDIHIRKHAGEKIEYIVKRGNMIVVKTSRRIITYDGRRHSEREARL